MKSEVEQIAQELAAARKAGSGRVLYSAELKRRVAALYRRQGVGAPLTHFAKSLGISTTAVTTWLKEEVPKTGKMVPVRIAPPAKTAAPSSIGSGIVLSYQGVEIRLPLATPPSEVAKLAKALAEGGRC